MLSSKKFNMNTKLISFFVGAFCVVSLYADNNPEGARQGAMGGTGVTTKDVWGIYHNQATLAFLKDPAMGFFYENRFLNSIGDEGFAFVMPTEKSGAFGLNVNYLGVQTYSDMKVGLAYALALSPKFSLGMQLDYFHSQYGDIYNRTNDFLPEVGFLAEPFDGFFVGAHIFNPWSIASNRDDMSELPTVFRIGMGYKIAKNVFTTLETEKDMDYKARYRFGLEYLYQEKVSFRFGVASNPGLLSFGIGYQFGKFRADIGFYSHPELGITPQVSLNYVFGSNVNIGAAEL